MSVKMHLVPTFAPALSLSLSSPLPSLFVCPQSVRFSTMSTTPKVVMTTTPATADITATTTTEGAQLTNPAEPLKLPDPFPKPPHLTTLGHQMTYKPKDRIRKFATSFRLFKQVRGRLNKGTILTARVSGDMSDRTSPFRPFSTPELSLPLLTEALRLAAYDPRIAHVHLRIDPLTCGWAKVLELRRHLEFFASSGKSITAYMEMGGPKEYFLCMGFGVYVPAEGSLNLRGFMSSGTFVRGVLDKIGISPQVERIGKYKSFGDTLMRSDMAPEQREVITALLGDVHRLWSESVCEVTGLSREQLSEFVDRSPWSMKEYVDVGLVTGTCYESQLEDALKLRFAKRSAFGGDDDEEIIKKKLPAVDVFRYSKRVSPKLLAISGQKRIAIIRAVGAITPGRNGSSPVAGTTVGSDTLVELIRRVRNDKQYVGLVLRCDSPGGAALSSDIVWNELRALRAVKPVVASQSDVAASGGYYLSMACEIVSEALTITGSVGVVTAKPSLGELYRKIGYAKENISVGGKYAELLVEDRPFSEDEYGYFREGARLAYDQFVNKAALSRDKTVEEMEKVAQGRVWTGLQAHDRGMVDHIGGFWRAVEVLKDRCEISDDFVKIEEITPNLSFFERLGAGVGTRAETAGTTYKANAPMFDAGAPLALSDIDGSLGGTSPLSKVIVDIALAPLLAGIPVLGKLSEVVEGILKSANIML